MKLPKQYRFKISRQDMLNVIYAYFNWENQVACCKDIVLHIEPIKYIRLNSNE